MRTFYFVDGRIPGHADEFFRRVADAGGPPRGWRISPHASGDGQALHVVLAECEDAIAVHLAQSTDIYEATPIEIIERR